MLLHPAGPLGTVRAGMLLADVTPALQAEANQLKGQLTELAGLRSLQEQAGKTLGAGLQAAQEARSALSTAISERTELPRRFTEDPEVLRGLLESADTLEAFAAGLAAIPPQNVLTIACSVLQSDYRSVLPKVQVPTLIIQARGHLPHITTPDEVLRPLEEFLGQ